MSRAPSFLAFSLAAGLAIAALGSCFNPDYGEGGFSCEEGTCPPGYTCVQVGAERVCRQEGMPILDGGLPDKEGQDAARKDGPRTDGLAPDGDQRQDGLLADGPLSDGPRLDRPTLDLATDQTQPADAPAADLSVPDQSQGPDLHAHPTCLKLETVAKDVRNEVQAFDLVIDNQDVPYVVLTDMYNTLLYTWRLGANSWQQPAGVGPTAVKANRLAAAISLPNAAAEHLQVVYSPSGSLITPAVLHTYRDLRAFGPWSAAATVSASDAVVGLDIVAMNLEGYISVSGAAATGPFFTTFRLGYGSAGYTYKPLQTLQSGGYRETRLGVGSTHWAYSVYQENSTGKNSWGVGRETHSGNSPTTASIPSDGVAPAAVEVSSNGAVHLAYVRRPAYQIAGSLRYASWSVSGTAMPSELTLISTDDVLATSVDLVLDDQQQPIIIFMLKGQGLMAYHRVNTQWILYPLASVSAGIATRAVVFKDRLQIVFDAWPTSAQSSTLNYITCQLP